MRFSRQFQACFFFFFYEKVLSVRKAPKPKTNDFHPLRSFGTRKKLLPLLLSVCLILFCLLIFACECFFYVQNLLAKKPKKNTGLKLS